MYRLFQHGMLQCNISIPKHACNSASVIYLYNLLFINNWLYFYTVNELQAINELLIQSV